MPQPNDAELTRIVAVSTGTTVQDTEPNTPAPAGAPVGDYQVIVEAIAGNVIGPSRAPYTLEITCIDEVVAAPELAMSIPVLNQEFGDPAAGWSGPVGAVGNFTMSQTFLVKVPAGLRGHVFHYVGRLLDKAGNVVSFIDSDRFILL
jgi:hypothetical protein